MVVLFAVDGLVDSLAGLFATGSSLECNATVEVCFIVTSTLCGLIVIVIVLGMFVSVLVRLLLVLLAHTLILPVVDQLLDVHFFQLIFTHNKIHKLIVLKLNHLQLLHKFPFFFPTHSNHMFHFIPLTGIRRLQGQLVNAVLQGLDLLLLSYQLHVKVVIEGQCPV